MASVTKREWTTPAGEKRQAWTVRWLEAGQHRSKGGFRLKKDADAYGRRVEDDRAAGRLSLTPLRKGTVESLVDEYLKNIEDRVADGRTSRTRQRNIRMACNVSILPRLGKLRLGEVDAAKVEAFFVAMVRKDGLSAATARARVSELKLLFRFGVRRGYLAANPVEPALAELGGGRADPIRTMTLTDVQAVLAAVETRGKWCHARTQAFLRCAVHLAAFCGLRQGEILALTRRRVRLEEGVIEVRHSITPFDEMKEPKTRAGLRDVPLPPHLVTMLRDWIARHALEDERGLLFRTPSGKQLHGSSVTGTLWRGVLDRAGLLRERDNFHFHALRHFAASWWIHHNMPITDTAALMGHAKFDVTLQVYAHPIVGGSRRREVLNAMAGALLTPPEAPHPV